MRDRLPDLIRIAESKGIKSIKNEETRITFENKELENFNACFSVVNKEIAKMTKQNDALEKSKDKMADVFGEKKQEFHNTLKMQLENNEKSKQMIMDIIKTQMDPIVKKKNEEDPEKAIPETRIINNLFHSIINKFEDVVRKYDTLNFEITKETQNLIIRDAETVLVKQFNEEEREAILSNPQQIIQDQMKNRLLESAHTSLKNAVYDIEERYNDLKNLEKNVLAIRQLFADLAILVAAQGEMINNIESNIHSAKEYVFHAEKDLVKAKENLASARKKKCCILIIVLVIIVVIVAPVLGTTLGKA